MLLPPALFTACDKEDDVLPSTVRLSLALPEADFPAYTPTRTTGSDSATHDRQLRLVIEVFPQGENTPLYDENAPLYNDTQFCTLQADGTYLAELSLMPGNYDLRLWADWNGGYYNTDDLSAVTVLTDSYVANGETDKKDAYYGNFPLTISPSLTLPRREGTQTGKSLPSGEVGGASSSPSGGVEGAISLERPFARYRLIANDVEGYLNLIKNGENLPAIEDLQVRVTYEGFFPTGFNVATGKPNDALNTSIHYTSVPTVADGYDEATARQVGADFVLTNGEESAVTVTIQMIDTNTDETVCTR